MRKHTEHRGDGGSLELHHGHSVGRGTIVAPTQGFLSLMRAAVAVLGFLVMAVTSASQRPPAAIRFPGRQVFRGGKGTRTDVESV